MKANGKTARILARLAAAAFVAGCASGGQSAPASNAGVATAGPTVLLVENQSFHDMHVFAATGSRRVRIGYVPSKSAAELTIPSSLVSEPRMLTFFAEPVGLNRTSVSDELYVAQGDHVRLLIPAP